MEEIKIGDYVEGIEQWGCNGHESYHKMRIVVKEIRIVDGHTDYFGRADDTWGGARGCYVSTEFGEVKIITDEKPFTKRWWEKEPKERNETPKAWRREWKSGDAVRHFKGKKYIIVGVGTDTETEQEVVIYYDIDETEKLWVRPREMFESEVDKKKYPDCEQQWRFEHVRD